MKNRGMVHVYHGDGKGKTTCGMGLCCRAAGAGLKVLIYQFMKDGCGNERRVLESCPNVTFANEKRTVCFSFRLSEAQKEQAREYLGKEAARIFQKAGEESFDVLFLDEVLYAVNTGLMEEKLLTDFLDSRPDHLEVILTGRNPSEAILERADYVSRIVREKHPFDRGVTARDGIER